MKINELLDEAAKKFGSDYKVAKALGITPAAISNVRKRGKNLSDYHAAKLAEMLGLSPIKVIVGLKAAKAKTREEAAYWGKLKGLAAAGLLALTMYGGAPSTSHANAQTMNGQNIQCAQ